MNKNINNSSNAVADPTDALTHDEHFNESIVNEVIIDEMKKIRIYQMKYIPDIEV